MTNAEKREFINTIGPMIQEEAKKRGYKTCAAVVAQACCEGNFGQSVLAKRYNNHFGLKTGSSWKGPSVNLKTKEEYQPGVLSTIRDNFRCYSDMRSGVSGYYDFVSTSRYKKLREVTTAKEYAQALKAAGYATSNKYVNTLLSYINAYGLLRFDGFEVNPYKLSVSVLKQGSKGESVKYIQWILNQNGANLKIDGIFGVQTKLAVLLYQKDHGLVADGVVGKKTLSAMSGG